MNAYILLHRNQGYKYYPYKSISELYVTDSTLYLKDMNFEGDSVTLFFSKSLEGKYFDNKVDGSYEHKNLALVGKNETLTFHVLDSFHSYAFQDLHTTHSIGTIEVKIDHSSFNGITQNELLFCNLPGPQIKVSKLKTWQSDKGFLVEEQQQAINILKEQTTFNKDSSDFYNTLAITKFVASLCKNPNGIHPYKLSELRPYGQIQEALKCKADLACGNYAAMIGYLFSVAKIPNRMVTFRGPAGNWQYGIHYYSEIFLREKQQWVLIDAANKMAMPFDTSSHRLLNAVDVKNLIHLNSTAGKLAYAFIKDSVKIVPYDSVNSQHIYYNQSNANLCFLHGNADVSISPFRNFIEFYTFTRDFDYYSEVNRNDWGKIIVKEAAILLLILGLFFYISIELKYKFGKHKQ